MERTQKNAEQRGWEFDRLGKKHDIYRHPDKDYFIQIERHDAAEVKHGLLRRLLKQIGE